ncbi:hypothetical protein [Roseivivax sp. CAU 1761]
MSDLQEAIDALVREGFEPALSTPEGRFFRREIGPDDEISVHVTSRAFPKNEPGLNIWLQDPRNARPKYREDVFVGEAKDLVSEMLDHVACLRAHAAGTTVKAVSILQSRLGGAYSDFAHPEFPSEDPEPHRDYARVQRYMFAQRRRLGADPTSGAGEQTPAAGAIPDLAGKVTPGKMYKNASFRLADVKSGFAKYDRQLEDVAQELSVAHISSFADICESDAVPSEGYVVTVYDEASHGVSFQHHLPEDEGGFVDQERAFMLAAAVEASRKSFVADGAEFLATYLCGAEAKDAAFHAFEMLNEDRYEALGEGADELLWWQFADGLHERVFGFSYDVESLVDPEFEATPMVGP